MAIFHELTILWVLVAIVGLVASGFFYYRGVRKLLAAGGGTSAGVGRRMRHGPQQEGAGRLITPPAKEGQGQQQDLLAGLGDAQDRTNTEAMADSDYGVDQGRTTRLSPRKPLGERKTLQMQPAADADGEAGLQDAIREAVEDSLEKAFGIEEQAGDPAAAQTPPDQGERRRKRTPSSTELYRKAQRHEDLGLHVGIKPDELLEKQRLATRELDDILARLDDALGTPAEEAERPGDTDAPVVLRDTAEEAADAEIAAVAGSQDPTTVLGTRSVDQDPHATRTLPGASAEPDSAPGEDRSILDQDEGAERDEDEDGDALPASGATDAPAPPAATAPGGPEVPSWARADTFDEDVGEQGGDPKQQSLFD